MPEIVDPIVVQEMFDVDRGYPIITLDQNGARANRTFRINRNTDANIIAEGNGIPRPGDTHPRAPGMVCISAVPERRETDGYWTFVRCEYVTTSGVPTDLIIEDGDNYHEIIANETQLTVYKDRDNQPFPTIPGQDTTNTQIKAFTLELVVTAVRTNPSARTQWFSTMMGRTNRNNVFIPNMLNKPGTGFTAAPGQLLFKGVSVLDITSRTGIIKLQYAMDLAPDHAVRFTPLDADGRPIPGAPPTVRYPYPEVDFPAGVFW